MSIPRHVKAAQLPLLHFIAYIVTQKWESLDPICKDPVRGRRLFLKTCRCSTKPLRISLAFISVRALQCFNTNGTNIILCVGSDRCLAYTGSALYIGVYVCVCGCMRVTVCWLPYASSARCLQRRRRSSTRRCLSSSRRSSSISCRFLCMSLSGTSVRGSCIVWWLSNLVVGPTSWSCLSNLNSVQSFAGVFNSDMCV